MMRPLAPPSAETKPGYWQLVDAGEPFRLLFPLGAAIGIVGVLLWPLYVWKVTSVYPGPFHARIMIEGFLTAFVIGFLGTALPRLMDAPGMRCPETIAFATAVTAIAALHATARTWTGDLFFLLTMLALIVTLGRRALWHRQDVPPPGFVLVMLGLGCAVSGTATQLIADPMPRALPEGMAPLGRLLLLQGYLLFPTMGIGAFLLPRFFGLPAPHEFPESRSLPPGWIPRAAFAFGCGTLVLAGFVAETAGFPHWGNAFKAAGVVLYFLRETPVFHAGCGGGSLGLGLRIALLSIPLAFGLMALWPDRTPSFLHLLYISGFSLLTLMVASRVVLGHGGQSERQQATLKPVIAILVLVMAAMVTRVTADWLPETRMLHYAYAALSWAAATAVWLAFVRRSLKSPPNASKS